MRIRCRKLPLRIWFILLFGWTAAQAQVFPVVGAKVPAFISSTGNGTKQCETGTGRHDPCATVILGGHRVTVAWDQQTNVVTYLFTDDRSLIGDSELSIGGSCRIVGDGGRGDSRLARYGRWMVAEDWKESFREWSGDATWYAALQVNSSNPSYATIVGFVQSRNLKPSH